MPPRNAPTGLLPRALPAIGVEPTEVVAESRNVLEEWKDRPVVVLRRREMVGGWRRARMLPGVRSLDSMVDVLLG